MAALKSEKVVLEVSRMLRNGEDAADLITDEIVSTLEEVVQQLVGQENVMVEIEKE